MLNENIEIMREWASVNGAIVRQRTVRQETTMAKAGTLPHSACNKDLTLNKEHLEIEDRNYIDSNVFLIVNMPKMTNMIQIFLTMDWKRYYQL